MSDLLAHIKTLNAETEAWLAEDEGRWAGLITEDLDHWAGYGIYTAEQYDDYLRQATYSDYFKSVMGFRPYHDTSDWTDERWAAEFTYLDAEAEWQAKAEKLAEEKAISEFEDEIALAIKLGAGDRETALRWMTQEDEEGFYSAQDVEHWVYNRGLLFTEYGKALVKTLLGIVTIKEWEEV